MQIDISLVFLLLACHHAVAVPLIIRSMLGSFDEGGHQGGGGAFGVNSEVGISSLDNAGGFKAGNDKQFASGADTGHFAADQHDKKVNLDEGKFGNDVFHKVGGGTISDVGQNVNHKKGHQKNGFHNTYHKDESGSNSSYFDNLNDEGGRYEHDTRNNHFGEAGDRRQNGYYSNGNDYSNLNSRRGGHNHGAQYSNDQGDRNAYNREKYYNDHRLNNRNNANDYYGNSGRKYYEEARLHPRYDPYYNRKITVYEDPSYGAGRFARNNYYDDGLDFRPPTAHPYLDSHAFNKYQDYDYYY